MTKRILCIAATPAFQQIMTFPHYRPGSVNRAADTRVTIAGKGVNTARAATLLGCRTTALICAGGYNRGRLEASLDRENIGYRIIDTGSPVRTCITIRDETSGGTVNMTELVEESLPLSQDVMEALIEAVRTESRQADLVLLCGNPPPETPHDLYRRVTEVSAVPVMIDARGPWALEALAARPLLLKMNREEWEDMKDAVPSPSADAGDTWLFITDGPSVALLSRGDTCIRLTPPVVTDVVNTVGCGDATTGGLAVAWVEGRPMPEAAARGLAAGSASALTHDPGRLDPARAQDLFAQVRV